MIDELVCSYWKEPPDEMAFELNYGALLEQIDAQLAIALDPKTKQEAHSSAFMLYVMTQAIPRVILNYKICIEFGLPLSPTEYVDYDQFDKSADIYPKHLQFQANALFLKSIDLARRIYNLDSDSRERLADFKSGLPLAIIDWEYTNTKDKYTWQASQPSSVRYLAEAIKQDKGSIDLVIGAAHGSIRPAVLLANLLGCNLHFVRYSRFKRADPKPIRSYFDEFLFEMYRNKNVVLFDEDLAKGTTMKGFSEKMQRYFDKFSTAVVLAPHVLAGQVDFCGELFY